MSRQQVIDQLSSRLRDALERRVYDADDPANLVWLAERMHEAAEALHRADAGLYGVCADCEGDIPLTRLKVKPEAIRCVACQVRHEQRSQRPRVRVA